MALAINIEGKGVIANADAFTNDTGGTGTGDWGFSGSGGVSTGLTTDTFYYGAASISAALSGAKNGWLYFDIGAGNELDFTAITGLENGQHIYMWAACPTLGLMATLANAGFSMRIGSSLTDYRTYTFGGTDGANGWDGKWKCFVVDPNKAGSITDGGTFDVSSVRYIGVRAQSTATAKGDNVFISQLAVGSGLRITGTSTTAWEDAVTYTTDLVNRAWGMLQEREGIYYAYGKINIGDEGVSGTHTGGTSSTVMTDSAAVFGGVNSLIGQTIYNTTDSSSGVVTANTGTTITVASLTGGTNNDFRVNDVYTVTSQIANVSFADSGRVIQYGLSEYYNITPVWASSADLDYSGINIEDRTTFTTVFTDGVIVGTEQGRSGSVIIGNANHDVSCDFYGGNNAASITALYGTTLQALTGLLNSGDDSGHKFLSVSWIGCNQFDPVGAPLIRNNIFAETVNINGALLWNANIDVEDTAFIANTLGEAIEHDTWNGTESGTATTTDATGVTLTDTAATFTGNVAVNDIVYNETTGGFGTVTSITDNTHLVCSAGLSTGGWTSTDVYSIGTPISYTNLTFSGNTVDVNNTTSPANVVAISKAGTSNPVTENGFTVIQGSVTVQVTVKDKTGTVISGMIIGIFVESDRTEIMNQDTNGSGIASTTYAGVTPVSVEVRWRKGSLTDNPKYIAGSTIQTIKSGTGLDLQVTAVVDTNNNATT